jgi:Nucleotide-diphospho-sugar transferase
MRDKTVILTTLNAAWASPGSVVDLFMESFQTGETTRHLLNHLVIISLDMKAYKRCMAIHAHCFALTTEGVDFSGEKSFMSKGYLRMMWRRVDFFRVVLAKGYNFIFSVSFSEMFISLFIFALLLCCWSAFLG